jgi:hypothetical protein
VTIVGVAIRRAELRIEGVTMSRSRAAALAERALAMAAEQLEGGVGGRVLQIEVEVSADRTDDAGLTDSIAHAIRAAIGQRLDGREPW